jgi:hypothetical protein
MLIGVVRFRVTDVMETSTKKSFNFRLVNLGELVRVTKYNHVGLLAKKARKNPPGYMGDAAFSCL